MHPRPPHATRQHAPVVVSPPSRLLLHSCSLSRFSSSCHRHRRQACCSQAPAPLSLTGSSAASSNYGAPSHPAPASLPRAWPPHLSLPSGGLCTALLRRHLCAGSVGVSKWPFVTLSFDDSGEISPPFLFTDLFATYCSC
jgi:hypothetical protein